MCCPEIRYHKRNNTRMCRPLSRHRLQCHVPHQLVVVLQQMESLSEWRIWSCYWKPPTAANCCMVMYPTSTVLPANNRPCMASLAACAPAGFANCAKACKNIICQANVISAVNYRACPGWRRCTELAPQSAVLYSIDEASCSTMCITL